MNITIISVVRNEQDIIEPFVRHNLKFADRMMVMDNGSVDGTKAILALLAEEFPQLSVCHDDAFMDALQVRTNLLFKQACIDGCDYVVPLDADEFISSPSRADYEALLSSIPTGGVGIVPWQTYVIHPSWQMEAAVNPPWTVRYVRTQESPQYHKVIVHTAANFGDDVTIFLGSHEAICRSRNMPTKMLPTKLWHYPVRSAEQAMGRGVVAWMTYKAFNPATNGTNENYHKRELFDTVANGKIDLPSVAILYAQSRRDIDWSNDIAEVPIQFDYVRKYSDGKPLPAIKLVARSWEQWVNSLASREIAAEVVAA